MLPRAAAKYTQSHDDHFLYPVYIHSSLLRVIYIAAVVDSIDFDNSGLRVELAWQSEGACCVAAQNKTKLLSSFKETSTSSLCCMTMTTPTVGVGIFVLSVDIAVCLALLVPFSIITVKSHCYDRQYNRKQRIFLYLLLASLGYSVLLALQLYGIEVFRGGIYWGFIVLFDAFFCWAALYVCVDVYTTLRGTEFHCLRFRFHTVVEEVCILGVIITISAGFAAGGYFKHDNALGVTYILPITLVWFITILSIVFVLVHLCLASRRVEGGQLANRLKGTVTLLLLFVVCYSVGTHVVDAALILGSVGVEDFTWNLILETLYLLCYKGVPYMFVIFFGWKMLQDLGRQCCCRRYRRRRGYGQIPGQEERGVLSVQTGVPSTTRTYHTCDDVGTTRTYYTCDESEVPA